MAARRPEQLAWVVKLLAPMPGESVLEIGQRAAVSTGLLVGRIA